MKNIIFYFSLINCEIPLYKKIVALSTYNILNKVFFKNNDKKISFFAELHDTFGLFKLVMDY